MALPDYDRFTCNLCGQESSVPGDFHREAGFCSHCGANVRFRALMLALSHYIHGKPVPLSAFAVNKNVKAMGLSDAPHYANRLAALFDYTNFFYHTEPFLDICNIESRMVGSFDLLVTSDVFEHVPPPRHIAFVNSWHLLKPGGLLLLTVPYTTLPKTVEHFPDLYQFGIVQDETGSLLVNQTKEQTIEVYDNLTWHGGEGSTLEMRVFSEADLLQIISGSGFKNIRIWHEDVPAFGIHQAYQGCSYVITAVKDGSAKPVQSTQIDPYHANIYLEGTAINHFLPHPVTRVTGARAERAIAQWRNAQYPVPPSIFARVWRAIKNKFPQK